MSDLFTAQAERGREQQPGLDPVLLATRIRRGLLFCERGLALHCAEALRGVFDGQSDEEIGL